MTKKEKDAQRQQSIDSLRQALRPGDTVYAHVNSVARSGMSRHFDLFIAEQDPKYRGGKPYIRRITWDVANALGWTYDRRAEDLRVGGCGMDMGFHTVYTLARVLFEGGFPCIGEGCKANDHSNGDREFKVGKMHSDPGYALNKESI